MIEAIKRRVEREGLQERQVRPRHADRSRTAGAGRRRADRRRVPRDGAAGGRCSATSRKSLKPNGRIGIVDFTKDGGGPGPAMEERVDPESVIRDAEAAGLRLRSRGDFLRYQYLLVFGGTTPALDERGPAVLRRVPARRSTRSCARLVPDGGDRGAARRWPTRALAPSKRVRPVLTLLCAELCGGTRGARGAGRRGDRAGARVVADPRRSAVDGRRAAAARTAGESPGVRRSDRDPRRVRAAEPRVRHARARVRAAAGARITSLLSDAVGLDGPDRRAGGRSAGDRPADQLRDARADPPRQDRRAVRRRRDVRAR